MSAGRNNVTIIPATISQFTAMPINSKAKRKVAAYARVSTELEEQQSSYEAQVSYYTEYIKSRADWEFVDIYADEGISGCNTIKRDGFRKMVEDALAGKIGLIITNITLPYLIQYQRQFYEWVHFQSSRWAGLLMPHTEGLVDFSPIKNDIAEAMSIVLFHLYNSSVFKKHFNVVLAVDGHIFNQSPP